MVRVDGITWLRDCYEDGTATRSGHGLVRKLRQLAGHRGSAEWTSCSDRCRPRHVAARSRTRCRAR